jgi:peptide/nickel transport system permease protein
MQGVIIVLFILFNVLPVNSARMTLGQRADAETVKARERELRLNEPVWKRYLLYLNDVSPLSLLSSDEESLLYNNPRNYEVLFSIPIGTKMISAKAPYLGRSFQTNKKVSTAIGEKILNTFLLALFATIFASIVGVIMGIVAALKQYKWVDNFILVLSTLGISQPSYFSGIILILVLAIYLKDFTHLNISGSLIETDDYGDRVFVWRNLILPVLALGVRPVAIITQLTRGTMIETMSQDFIRTAKAKGLSYSKVIFKHALRNVMNPVITSISGWFASLLAGAFFVEIVFNFKGLGDLTLNGLLSFDFPIVMGCVLYIALIFVVVNIIVDVLYGILDPRVAVK